MTDSEQLPNTAPQPTVAGGCEATEAELCGNVNDSTPGYRYSCTRPKGHGGFEHYDWRADIKWGASEATEAREAERMERWLLVDDFGWEECHETEKIAVARKVLMERSAPARGPIRILRLASSSQNDVALNDGRWTRNFAEPVEQWLAANQKADADVLWGRFPLGMVLTWMERAKKAETALAAITAGAGERE